MSKPGPKPLPTHLKIVKGERKDRINTAEPIPIKKEPKCPTWLSDDGKKVWKKTAKQLKNMGLFFEADVDMIVAYCNAVVNYQRATEIVDKEGVLVEGRRDGQVANPAVRIQRDSATLMRLIGSELGLTPSSRSRITKEDMSNDEDILD